MCAAKAYRLAKRNEDNKFHRMLFDGVGGADYMIAKELVRPKVCYNTPKHPNCQPRLMKRTWA